MKTVFNTILTSLLVFSIFISFLLVTDYLKNDLIVIPIWLLFLLIILQIVLVVILGLITFKRKNIILIFITLLLSLPTLAILYYTITDQVHPMIRKYINGNAKIINQNKNITVFTDSILNSSFEVYQMNLNKYVLIHNDSKGFFNDSISNNWSVIYINTKENWVGVQDYCPSYYVKINDKLMQSDMGEKFVPIGFEIKSGINHETIITHTDSSLTTNLPKEAIYNTIELRY